MQVTSSTNAGSPVGASASAAGSANTLTADMNTFLKLFVTELQNQDPTSPIDTSAYMSQLAGMSSVEQAVQTNQKLDQLLTSTSLSQAEQAVGRVATSADGTQTGTITAVDLTSAGPVATLSDGTTLALGAGVKISGA